MARSFPSLTGRASGRVSVIDEPRVTDASVSAMTTAVGGLGATSPGWGAAPPRSGCADAAAAPVPRAPRTTAATRRTRRTCLLAPRRLRPLRDLGPRGAHARRADPDHRVRLVE